MASSHSERSAKSMGVPHTKGVSVYLTTPEDGGENVIGYLYRSVVFLSYKRKDLITVFFEIKRRHFHFSKFQMQLESSEGRYTVS
jgi:hypothetical protein